MLHTCATSLVRLQACFGTIRTVRAKGECSQLVARLMAQMRRALDDADDGCSSGAQVEPLISELLMIDRNIDLVSPLVTELTYEGLIHSVFGIQNGYVDLDAELLAHSNKDGAPAAAASPSAAPRRLKRELNNNDPLYASIRNLNFGELGPLLNRLARGVHEGYEQRHQAQTVSQIREFMKRLSRLQQVGTPSTPRLPTRAAALDRRHARPPQKAPLPRPPVKTAGEERPS